MKLAVVCRGLPNELSLKDPEPEPETRRLKNP